MEDRKVLYTRSLGKKVANGALPKKISKIHIITAEYDKWSVVLEGSTRSVKSDLSKKEALEFAKKIASSKSAELIVIHDKAGRSSKRLKVS